MPPPPTYVRALARASVPAWSSSTQLEEVEASRGTVPHQALRALEVLIYHRRGGLLPFVLLGQLSQGSDHLLNALLVEKQSLLEIPSVLGLPTLFDQGLAFLKVLVVLVAVPRCWRHVPFPRVPSAARAGARAGASGGGAVAVEGAAVTASVAVVALVATLLAAVPILPGRVAPAARRLIRAPAPLRLLRCLRRWRQRGRRWCRRRRRQQGWVP
mmetsp:Transcript_63707/g.206887  ORF Transcript_63707/g.206887 Transcript_63707/m.206887 type:complete len:214 (+) Transcript_63707:133-774(+)